MLECTNTNRTSHVSFGGLQISNVEKDSNKESLVELEILKEEIKLKENEILNLKEELYNIKLKSQE